MDLNLKPRKLRDESISTRYSVPTSPGMKDKLDQIKRDRKLDVNDLTRQFFDNLIKKVESGEITLESA